VLKSEFVWIWLPGLVLVLLCKIIRSRMRNCRHKGEKTTGDPMYH
jgi:hypothetical protein